MEIGWKWFNWIVQIDQGILVFILIVGHAPPKVQMSLSRSHNPTGNFLDEKLKTNDVFTAHCFQIKILQLYSLWIFANVIQALKLWTANNINQELLHIFLIVSLCFPEVVLKHCKCNLNSLFCTLQSSIKFILSDMWNLARAHEPFNRAVW